jgi:L-seryl-tRNA(Ser) seleniumtransferase
MSDVMTRWGLTPVINVAGTMTTLGASRAGPEVRAVVDDILGRFVRMDELQAAACRVIARATGAPAGYVTSSSSAGLTLACAAAITGEDLAAIESLPATQGATRVGLMAGHAINYGAPVAQAIAASGAEVVTLGTAALCGTFHLRAALQAGLTAAVYVVSHHCVRENELPLPVFVALCRQAGVPVIVDMASEYDLTSAVGLGADTVIWSGHKFLGGPTSGIVAGTRPMIRAMLLQNRGLGRLMKAGKEAVAGAMAALEVWATRDHAAAAAREAAIVEAWAAALAGEPGLTLARHKDWTGNPITRLEIAVDPAAAGLNAWDIAERCLQGSPAIALRDDLVMQQRLYLDPCNVTADEALHIPIRIREVLTAARASGDRGRSMERAVRDRSGVAMPWLDGDG